MKYAVISGNKIICSGGAAECRIEWRKLKRAGKEAFLLKTLGKSKEKAVAENPKSEKTKNTKSEEK